jgi:hypothetical protein
VEVTITSQAVQVRLSWWQKLLGLMRNITVPLGDVSGIEVIERPVSVAARAGIKVGLRLPFLCFVARTLRLDEAFVVRRGVPGLSIEIGGEGHLRRLLVSTPRAAELANELETARRSYRQA